MKKCVFILTFLIIAFGVVFLNNRNARQEESVFTKEAGIDMELSEE